MRVLRQEFLVIFVYVLWELEFWWEDECEFRESTPTNQFPGRDGNWVGVVLLKKDK